MRTPALRSPAQNLSKRVTWKTSIELYFQLTALHSFAAREGHAAAAAGFRAVPAGRLSGRQPTLVFAATCSATLEINAFGLLGPARWSAISSKPSIAA